MPSSRLLRAGLLTGVVDGLFATVQSLIAGSTVTRLWQGVASVLLGKSAFAGGTRTALIGVLMHFAVAFAWSAVFLLLVSRSASLRRVLASRGGIIKVALVYGPLIWVVMSCAVIPLLTHRPPNITLRWWVQLLGHFPFVGLPIVASIAYRRAVTNVPALSHETAR
jgi:uncharacterized membrane protein YagU involved in acid resistance